MKTTLERVARILYPHIFTQNEFLVAENAILAGQLDRLNSEEPPNHLPVPIRQAMLSSQVLRDLLSPITKYAHVLDRAFMVPTEHSWDAFLAADQTDSRKYVSASHDCDNFAINLAVAAKNWMPGCATGLMMDLKHAWTIVILQNAAGEFYVRHIEPQSDGDVDESHMDNDYYLSLMW